MAEDIYYSELPIGKQGSISREFTKYERKSREIARELLQLTSHIFTVNRRNYGNDGRM